MERNGEIREGYLGNFRPTTPTWIRFYFIIIFLFIFFNFLFEYLIFVQHLTPSLSNFRAPWRPPLRMSKFHLPGTMNICSLGR